MSLKTNIAWTTICAVFIFIFLQGCTNDDEGLGKEERENIRIEQLLKEAGFTKVEAVDKKEKVLHLTNAKEVLSFLETRRKHRDQLGIIRLDSKSFKVLKDGTIRIKVRNKLKRTIAFSRLPTQETWNYNFDIEPISFSFTLELNRFNDWRIKSLENVNVDSSQASVWVVDYSQYIFGSNGLEFYIEVRSSEAIFYDDNWWTRKYERRYDFEVEVWRQFNPDTYYGILKYNSEEVASSKKD